MYGRVTQWTFSAGANGTDICSMLCYARKAILKYALVSTRSHILFVLFFFVKRLCSHFHLHKLQREVMLKTRPANATVSFRVTHELPIQIREVTIVKPPSPRQVVWAAPGFPLVIVAVSRAEHHVAMVTQRVPGCAVVTADRHFVLSFFVVHLETVVSRKNFFPVPIFELDSQRHLLGWSDAMNLVVSKPEIPFEVPKAMFVVFPRAMKADGGVLSSLEHNPTSTVSLQITVYLKICFPVRVYRVHTTRSVAGVKDINTFPRWIKKKINPK